MKYLFMFLFLSILVNAQISDSTAQANGWAKVTPKYLTFPSDTLHFIDIDTDYHHNPVTDILVWGVRGYNSNGVYLEERAVTLYEPAFWSLNSKIQFFIAQKNRTLSELNLTEIPY